MHSGTHTHIPCMALASLASDEPRGLDGWEWFTTLNTNMAPFSFFWHRERSTACPVLYHSFFLSFFIFSTLATTCLTWDQQGRRRICYAKAKHIIHFTVPSHSASAHATNTLWVLVWPSGSVRSKLYFICIPMVHACRCLHKCTLVMWFVFVCIMRCCWRETYYQGNKRRSDKKAYLRIYHLCCTTRTEVHV